MNKVNFMALLRSKLYDLPYNEVDKIIEYYNEYIEDAKESGKSEDEIVAGLGDTNMLVNKLRAELSFETALKKPTLSNGMKVLIAIMGVFTLPVTLPILGTILGLFVAFIAIGISLFVALIACIGVVVALIASAFATYPSDPAMIAFIIGGSLVAIGVLTLLFVGFMALLRFITKGFIQLADFIYKRVSNKE